MAHLRTVRLYGKLGSKFGRVHQFVLESNSVAEAVQALHSQLEGFGAFLLRAKDNGLAFAVFAGKRNLAAEELQNPVGDADIRIAPVVIGSKAAGMGQFIAGAVLFVVGAVVTYFSGGSASAIGGGLMKIGVAMMIGGVVQMLSPQPKGLKNSDRPDNQPSYVFNGAVNTQAQGNPVPVGYGRMIVGSAVISAGIQAEDYAPATNGVGLGTPGGSAKKNFYQVEA
jgi:predicted phage tail protein